jgi:hypothetical protein
MKRETEMRATIVERKDIVPVVHDEQWTGTAMDDGHALGLQLLECPGADPIISRGFHGSHTTGLDMVAGQSLLPAAPIGVSECFAPLRHSQAADSYLAALRQADIAD